MSYEHSKTKNVTDQVQRVVTINNSAEELVQNYIYYKEVEAKYEKASQILKKLLEAADRDQTVEELLEFPDLIVEDLSISLSIIPLHEKLLSNYSLLENDHKWLQMDHTRLQEDNEKTLVEMNSFKARYEKCDDNLIRCQEDCHHHEL
jgi:hypothetical protein